MKFILPSGRTLEVSDGMIDSLVFRTPQTPFHPSDVVIPRPEAKDYLHTMEIIKGDTKFISRHGSMEETELAAVAFLYFLGATVSQQKAADP